MKRTIVVLVSVMMMITWAHGQRYIDLSAENSIINLNSNDEANCRTFSFKIYPFKLGWDKTFMLGFFLENHSFHARDLDENWASRLSEFSGGIAFNKMTGYNFNWAIEGQGGFGITTTRSEANSKKYWDKQRDYSLFFSFDLAHYREDLSWFGRHQFHLRLRQPVSTTKEAYWEGNPIEVMTWDNQIFRGYFTETVFSDYIDKCQCWRIGIDGTVGVGMEHDLNNELRETLTYPTIALGVSFFDDLLFNKNVLQVGAEYQMNPINRWLLTAKVNFISLFYLVWPDAEGGK